MKKLIALLLVAVMLLSLAACGSGSKSDKDDDSKGSKKVTFTELSVADNDECMIKVTGLKSVKPFGYSVEVQLENKSADKEYTFTTDGSSIDGIECYAYFSSTVPAGKKSKETIEFSLNDLEENGIKDVTDIKLTFRVYDSEDWSAEDVVYESVHIYPYGEENAKKYERTAKKTDKVILDNDYAKVVVTGYEHDDVWGYSVNLYIINKSGKDIMFAAEDTSVNGYMVNPFFSNSVSAGNCEFTSMSWLDSTLEENGIDDVEEIEFTLRAYDMNDWFAGDLANENIILNP